jgi:hypothetical protein
MPDDTPNAMLTACALVYTCSPPPSITAGILHITTNTSFLDMIIKGYKSNKFSQQVLADITAGSIEGAVLENGPLYVGHCLLIPSVPEICELLYGLAHDTLGNLGFNKSYEAL